VSGYDSGDGYQPSGASSPGLWLGLSIASTACCCLPFGIVGIVYSAMAINARNRDSGWEAESYTAKARGWTIASIICGLIAGVIYLLVNYQSYNSY
jgi:hypothetical protein